MNFNNINVYITPSVCQNGQQARITSNAERRRDAVCLTQEQLSSNSPIPTDEIIKTAQSHVACSTQDTNVQNDSELERKDQSSGVRRNAVCLSMDPPCQEKNSMSKTQSTEKSGRHCQLSSADKTVEWDPLIDEKKNCEEVRGPKKVWTKVKKAAEASTTINSFF